MKQGTILVAVKDFTFKANGRGRPVVVKVGQRFRVITTKVFFNKHNGHCIDREKKGHISGGWFFDTNQLNEFFKVTQ